MKLNFSRNEMDQRTEMRRGSSKQPLHTLMDRIKSQSSNLALSRLNTHTSQFNPCKMADWEDFKIFLELLNQLDLTALCYGSFSQCEFWAILFLFCLKSSATHTSNLYHTITIIKKFQIEICSIMERVFYCFAISERYQAISLSYEVQYYGKCYNKI